MANLTNADVQRLFRDRPHRKEIERGVKHNNRLRFHTETVVDKNTLQSNAYFREFINWIAADQPELLPKDKVERFKQLITVPLPTIELTESIFSHLYNVFKGQDSFYRYQFENPETDEDWNGFVNYEFWETHGFAAMINAIDSVWVLDLPKDQVTELPEPKDRLIDISTVIDIDVDPDNNCQYIIFRIGDYVYQYDDTFIRVYKVEKDKLAVLPELEIAHALGYCPARMFWSDPLMVANTINKKAPLTNVLGDLDWLLVCHVFKKYMEIANSYPILATYAQRDNYEGSRQESDRGRPEESKTTQGGAFIGAGTQIQVETPLAGEHDPMANPVKFINPDVNTLQFHVDNIIDKRDTIFYSVVGKDSDTTKEAVNEKQVMASFESQSSILMKIAQNFKKIQEFAEKCKADIRYGVGQLTDISIDFGTKFFLRSATDLIGDLEVAKKNGSHSSVVTTIMDEITEAKFRNDKIGMQRATILQELDPLPDKTFDEAVKILEKGAITKEQFIIKMNLPSFAKRFEREQAPLTEFASARPYSTKIDLILEEFEKYAEEITGEDEETEMLPDKETFEAPELEPEEDIIENAEDNEISPE